jgi:ADP-ribosylglycohydrolase
VPVLPEEDPRWQPLRLEPGQGVDLRDHFRGALIGGGIGDAMGRANEGVRPREARKRQIRDYQPWHGWRSGPKGTITDDPQMTMWLAEAILGASHEPRAVSREPRERAEGQRGAGGHGDLRQRGVSKAYGLVLDSPESVLRVWPQLYCRQAIRCGKS